MNRKEAEALKVFRDSLEMNEGETFHLRYGPLDLYIEKIRNEIRLRWMTSNDWIDASFHHQFPFKGMLPETLLKEKRFAFSSVNNVFQVVPCLGERSFVAQPEQPFMILPGEKAKIYMSTPMNLRLLTQNQEQILDEIPVIHRTQTWFGDSPTAGELCFFTHIKAALNEEDLPFRPHRALTHVMIENKSKMTIPIEKLKIPVNFLTLYQDARGLFVTSSLYVKCDLKGAVRDIKVVPPSQEHGDLFLIHEPRDVASSLFYKTISEFMR